MSVCRRRGQRGLGRRFSDVSRALALILDLIGGILYGLLRFVAARLGLEGVDKLCRRFRVERGRVRTHNSLLEISGLSTLQGCFCLVCRWWRVIGVVVLGTRINGGNQ